MQRFINNWAATLTAPATSGDLTLSVEPAQAAKLVGLGSGDYYLLTLAELVDDAETSWEIVKVTAVIGGVLTVERGMEGTTAAAWSVDAYISARATAGTLEDLRDQAAVADTAVQPGDLATVATTGAYADLAGLPTIPTTAAEVGAIAAAEKGAASGVATLDAGSKIPLAQLPATAITDTSVVASQAAMLALTAQTGDVAIRTDIDTSFILVAEPASTLANWQELLSPAAGGGAPVGSATPQPLGTSTPGVSTSASRQDHVHAMPTAADVGADAAGAAADARAAAVQRSNHTGTQLASTISNFAATVLATVLSGLSLATGSAVVDTDSVLAGVGKLQRQINDLATALGGKQATLVSGTNIKTINGASVLGAGDLTVSGSGAAWGDITGTLADQTDLAAALATKAAKTTSRTITGTTGTLIPSDAGKVIICTNAGAVTLTVQLEASGAWDDASVVHILQTGAGVVTVADGSGITVNVYSGLTKAMRGQYGSAALIRTASDTFVLSGTLGGTPA